MIEFILRRITLLIDHPAIKMFELYKFGSWVLTQQDFCNKSEVQIPGGF